MNTELVVALISAAVALSAAGLAAWTQFRSARLAAEFEALRLAEQRRLESEAVAAGYREPLARAAYDLQSRLYNILEQDFVGVYLTGGDERSRRYVVDNTTFLIAQYLAWTEIIRRDIQFIDLGQDEPTRRLARLQDDIYALFQTDRYPPLLRIFAGEQRAIGERMIRKGRRGLECAGYADFLDRLEKRPDPLLEHLRQDVASLGVELTDARPRLVALQNALVDLLAFLDPQFVRFAADRRTKVSR